jgi:hypothetical protein
MAARSCSRPTTTRPRPPTPPSRPCTRQRPGRDQLDHRRLRAARPSRGNGWTVNGANGKTSGQIYTDADNTWGNNTNGDLATAAVDAQAGVAKTWDFYLTLGRAGIANDGKGAQNRVHYGRNYVNAYWSDSCFCMTYGDGDGRTYGPLVNLDVAGHEMSHGVMSREANLTYSGESGGLNEANSDIMGTMVEFYANNTEDKPDYMIGEEIYIANVSGAANQKALRYMYNPIKDTRSPNCYASNLGTLDVHYSSGVANHFFYLLAEGSGAKTFNGVDHTSTTCNGSTITGISRDTATQIWYRAVRDYMTAAPTTPVRVRRPCRPPCPSATPRVARTTTPSPLPGPRWASTDPALQLHVNGNGPSGPFLFVLRGGVGSKGSTARAVAMRTRCFSDHTAAHSMSTGCPCLWIQRLRTRVADSPAMICHTRLSVWPRSSGCTYSIMLLPSISCGR